MPVSLICPACGKSLQVYLPGTTACAACGAPFPERLLQTIRSEFRVSTLKRPALLTVGLSLSIIFGLGYLGFLILAPLGFGQYTINGREVTGMEFLKSVGVVWAVLGIVLFSIAFGLWKHRPWTRPLMLFFWILELAASVPLDIKYGDTAATLRDSLVYGICLVCAALYLYIPGQVREYYAMIGARHRDLPETNSR